MLILIKASSTNPLDLLRLSNRASSKIKVVSLSYVLICVRSGACYMELKRVGPAFRIIVRLLLACANLRAQGKPRTGSSSAIRRAPSPSN